MVVINYYIIVNCLGASTKSGWVDVNHLMGRIVECLKHLLFISLQIVLHVYQR